MCSRCLSCVIVMYVMLAGCKREERKFNDPVPAGAPVQSIQMSGIDPGGGGPKVTTSNEYEEVAYAVNEGKRLFNLYNCSGCHAHGGGGMGPPLMDDVWLYGSDPANVFDTVVEGRPNGMPAWGRKIPRKQIWQLVAYVRSLGGLVRTDVAPSRDDSLHPHAPESQLPKETPRQ
jgi:cytochrome c oxidase cbb3-type subunit III